MNDGNRDMIPLRIIPVQFQGDTLEAMKTPDGKVLVVLRRCCEALGIDYSSQHKRLTDPARSPWATVVMMTIVAEDGKQRQVTMIDLDSLPMWLATIEANRTAEAVREKLVRYQREATGVLRDHFIGKPTADPLVWQKRINDTLVDFECRLYATHFGRWSVFGKVKDRLRSIEPILRGAGLPLSECDLPDGSAGLCYHHFRKDKPWAASVVKDVPLALPDGEGGTKTEYPSIYEWAESEHFDRWLNLVYLPEKFPRYLDDKMKRDESKWLAAGIALPDPCRVGKAAEVICRQLTVGRQVASIPRRMQQQRPALMQAKATQGGLFGA